MPDLRPLDDGAAIELDEVETELLRQLTAELRAVISAEQTADPVLDRIFPAAYEDAKDEAAYRDLIDDDLQKEKMRALDTVSAALGDGPTEIEVTGEDFGAWLATLTDLRLAIGVRLDVDEERMGAEIDPRDPDARALTVLHWLGWLQEGLLRAAGVG